MSEGLRVEALGLSFSGRPVLDGIDLALGRGEAVALIGPSGAGKTSLLRCLLGLTRPVSGRVLAGGRPVAGMGGRERAGWMGWLPQISRIIEPIASEELVAAARFRFDEGRADCRSAARAALAECGVEHLAAQPVSTLSGGELQRVSVAALLAQDPHFLLLDEPSNHLDVRRQYELYELLGSQWRQGRGLVLVTHDLNLLAALGTDEAFARIRLVALKAGRLAWTATPCDADLAERMSELYELPMTAVETGRRRFILPRGTPS